ncbi:MAG: nucleotidyltransferase domain-containing protein [Mariniphaga sp.]|nr:nucleotidyltransferase domain-containing protein [Mariniphaga sp.]
MTNTGLNKDVIEKIKGVFALHSEVDEAVLYGSRAKGTYKPASDIDLTLIGKSLNLTIQQKIENELDDLLLPYKFDLSIHHQITNKDLIAHIERVGKPFFVKH